MQEVIASIIKEGNIENREPHIDGYLFFLHNEIRGSLRATIQNTESSDVGRHIGEMFDMLSKSTKRIRPVFSFAVVVLVFSYSSFAQEGLAQRGTARQDLARQGNPVAEEHDHEPIVLNSRPVVSQYEISLAKPRRVVCDSAGNLYVADWVDGTVTKIDVNGNVTIVAENFDQPAGLAFDNQGLLYISEHAQGIVKAGTIYRINSRGEKELFVKGLNGPSGLAFDSQNNLYVANYQDNSISKISLDRSVTTYAVNIPAPSDVIVNKKDQVFATSSAEGNLYRINRMGGLEVIVRGLNAPSDLALDENDRLIVTNFGDGSLTHVSENGKTFPFAKVPAGTIACCFDKANNLYLLNWELHRLTKITSRFFVPCPHCDKNIPVILKLKQQPKKMTDI